MKTKAASSKKKKRSISQNGDPQIFKICPKCGRPHGFHVVLLPPEGKKNPEFSVRLFCPKCHQLFQLGLLLEEQGKEKKIAEKKVKKKK